MKNQNTNLKSLFLITMIVCAGILFGNIETASATDYIGDLILFYTSANPVNSEYIRPLGGYINTENTPVDWMFDGIIMYDINLYQSKHPTQSTCDAYINDLFSNGQINTLDTIIGNLKDTLSQPNYKWNVVLTAPYADDMPDGNVIENCNTIINNWNQLSPSNLRLIGFYWGYRESVPEWVEPAIRNTSDFLHTKNLSLFWIPYHNAKGIPNWEDYGFDYVTKQPNYAFLRYEQIYEQIIGRDAYDKRLLLDSGLKGNILVQMGNSHKTTGRPVTWGEWHHIAYTSNGTTSHIYVNGSKVSSGNGGADFSSSKRVLIGQSVENAYPFNSVIDEVKIYSRVLSADEIQTDYNKSEVTEGVVGLWHFDEGTGTNAYDSSGYGNNGTINGASWTTGKSDFALEFDGNDDYVEIADNNSLDITDAITIIAWVKDDNAQRFIETNQKIINYNLAGMEFEFCDPTNGLSVDQNANDYLDYAEKYNWQENILNTYYHGGCISDFSRNKHRLLYDRIYEFIRAGEIKHHYEGLAAHWKFDEGSGTAAIDSSGNNNDGTLINNPQWVDGKIGNALDFDGTDDYVSVPNFNLPSNNKLSFEWWLKTDTLSGDHTIISDAAQSQTKGFFWIRQNNKFLTLNICNGVDQWGLNTSWANVFTDTNWHHFILVTEYDSDKASLYKDRVLVETKDILNAIPPATNGRTVYIGNYSPTHLSRWDGKIDGVRIYNRALTPEEVLANYKEGEGNDTTPPVRSNGSPSGTLSYGTTSTNISLSTNENATCKYGTAAGVSYQSLPNTFSTTGGLSHSQTITDLTDGQSYTYYIRCQDTIGNFNTDDYSISFSIGSSPVNHDPAGSLDSATQSQITGWAYDQNAGSNPIDVHIYIDGINVGSATANQSRQDLVDAGVCPDPNHGFTFSTPSLSVGEHTVTVYAINQPEGTNPELVGSPKTFNVSSSDSTPPTGSISINSGDEKTSFQTVNLSISANDPSGLSEMKISETNDFSSTIAEAYNTIKTFILSPIDGIKTVYVWFKDNIGNWNAEPYSDTVILDTASPTISNISISNITASAAKISFETNEPSYSYIEYGLTASYGNQTNVNTNPLSTFNIQLSNLSSNTTYHFKIISKDVLENESNSTDQTFKTIGLPDTIPPNSISNLSVSDIGQTSLDLNWTSPGDDGNNGIAAEYDIRYSLSQITTGNWNSATQLTAEPSPLVSGTLQLYTVVGLDSGTIYYFAIKTGDEVPNWSGLSNVKQTETLPYVPPTCISFTYSSWSECQPDNTQSRTVSTSSPDGCAGGNPILSRSCVYVPPTCTSFTYSLWGECQADDTQYRTVSTSSPEGCAGGNPILSQSCDYPDPVPPFCTSFTYSLWGECQADDTQYRTVSTSSPSGCTGGNPILSRSCVYVPPTCISFTYSSWSECQPDNTQYRTVSTSSPEGCAGGNPILSRSCTYVPSGGGGGGGETVLDTTPPNKPSNFKAIPADSQITLIWKNPSDSDFVRVLILRKENSAPLSHNDSSAVIIYEGVAEQYTDIELNNNTTYYYSIFAYDKKPNYSKILTISSKPEEGKESIEIPKGSSYPEGTLLKTADSFKIYVIINQKKKWIPTPEVFETLGYQWTSITIIDKNELTLIPDYEDNLIRAINDYKVYLIVNGIKRHIPNPEIFLNYGFEWNDVKDVSLETINQYTTSLLIKESKKGEIYYLCPERKIKRWLRSPEIFLSYNNKWEDIQVISEYEMDHYPESNLIKLYNSNDVYSIEGNQKRLIKTVEEFEREGLDWGRVMGVNGVEIGWWGN